MPSRTAIMLVALFALALLVRWPFLKAMPVDIEGGLYAVARLAGQEVSTVRPFGAEEAADAWPFFRARPLFYALLWPASQISLESARTFLLVLSALLAPGMFLLLRRWQVRIAWAAAGGLAVALSPDMAREGATFAASSLATLFVVVALLLPPTQGIWRAGVLAAGTLVDEAVLVVLGGTLAWELWKVRSRPGLSLWPVRLDRAQTAHLYLFLVANGLHVSVLSKQYLPSFGLYGSAAPASMMNGVLASLWFAAALVAGLALARTRHLAALGLALPALFLAAWLAGSSAVVPAEWVLPAFLAIAGAVATLATLLHASSLGRRAGAAAFSLFVVALAFAPAVPAKEVLTPGRMPVGSLPEAWDDAERALPYLRDLVAHLEPDRPDLFLIDVPWFHVYEPLYFRIEPQTLWYASLDAPVELHAWPSTIESPTVKTIVLKAGAEANSRLLHAYEACVVYENPGYAVIHGEACEGRGASAVGA